MDTRTERVWWGVAGGGFLAAAVAFVFWDALLGRGFVWGPDSGAYGYVYLKKALPDGYLGNWWPLDGLGRDSGPIVFVPYHFLLWLVEPLRCQMWTYIFSIAGSAGAAYYLFAGRGVRGAPALAASLAAGLTPHTVSLISAGHLGKLQMMPFAFLLLAAVDRAVTRRSMLHYALAGLAIAYGLVCGADIMFVFSILSAAYGLFLWIACRPRRSPPPGAWRRHLLAPVAGAALAACFTFAAGSIWVQQMVQIVLPSRDRLAKSSGPVAAIDEKGNKWEFATNWSLPPEEILEFVAPGVFGWQTGDPGAPYWGRLGRSLGWDRHHQGLMNLRQHTVYLGVVPIAFSLYAVAWAARRRRDGGAAQSLVGDAAPADDRMHSAQVFFWAGVAVVGVMLALGRYFFVYRVFYAIPFASNMRAPVKFLHVVEVALCVLFAFGLEAFLRPLRRTPIALAAVRPIRARRRSPLSAGTTASPAGLLRDQLAGAMALVCGGIGILLLVGIAVGAARLSSLGGEWASLGLAAYAQPLSGRLLGALGHGAILFFLCAGVMAAAWFFRRGRALGSMLAVVVIATVAIDLALVAKQYVAVWDEGARYRPDALSDRLAGEPLGYRVALAARGGAYERWRAFVFPMSGVAVTDVDPAVMPAANSAMLAVLKNDPLRLWMLTSTRSVIGPVSVLGPLMSAPGVETVGRFEITSDGGAAWAPTTGSQTWLRLRDVLPRAAVYHDWRAQSRAAMLATLGDPSWDPRMLLLVESTPSVTASGGPCTPARIVRLDYSRVLIEVDDPAGGVLVLNDLFDPSWQATVDGHCATVLCCNYLMRGVVLPPGHHLVEFTFRKYQAAFAFTVGAPCVWLLWYVTAAIRDRRRRRPSVV